MEIVDGREVSRFLERVKRGPDRYREIVICTPFLDDKTASSIRDLAVNAPRAHCGFTLLTRTEGAGKFMGGLPAPIGRWSRFVRVRHRVHAKIYMALGRSCRDSEAIVTSANLTVDGLGINDELGVRITGKTAAERLMLRSVKSVVQNWLY